MDFGRDELLWINNALNEVLNGSEAICRVRGLLAPGVCGRPTMLVEEWESHARMGGDRDQVRALLGKVTDLLDALRRADPDW